MREDLSRGFVRVPAREFAMGSDDGADDERPCTSGARGRLLRVRSRDHRRAVRRVHARDPATASPGIRDLPLVESRPTHESSFRELPSRHLARRRARATTADAIVDATRTYVDASPLAARSVATVLRSTANRCRPKPNGTRAARGDRADALSVGRRRRRLARELPARSGVEASSRHAAGRLLSAERPAAVRHGRQRRGSGSPTGIALTRIALRRATRSARPGSGTLRIVRGGSWVTHDVDQLRCP